MPFRPAPIQESTLEVNQQHGSALKPTDPPLVAGAAHGERSTASDSPHIGTSIQHCQHYRALSRAVSSAARALSELGSGLASHALAPRSGRCLPKKAAAKQ